MTKLKSELLGTQEKRRKAGRDWLRTVKETCPEVRFVSHYAILGRYDFMDIFEAPTVETAHRVSIISRAKGAIEAETWSALPYEKFVDMLGEISAKAS
ncbi:MAG: GYD domain-containing protein [Myxococcota bacterium]